MRFVVGAAILLGLTIAMAYVGAASNWYYYVTVDECLADWKSLRRQAVRVSGRIQEGSIASSAPADGWSFQLQGESQDLTVISSDPLPNTLSANNEVIVEGKIDENGVLRAKRVLTRCASKYSTEPTTKTTADFSASTNVIPLGAKEPTF